MPASIRPLSWGLPLALLVLSVPPTQADTRGVEFFEAKIRPVLIEHCFECHSAKASKVRGGLLLDTRDGVRNGGDNGPVIIPGEPDRSPLVKALKHDGLKMPPKHKLPASVVADFATWVKMGAPDPRTEAKTKLYRRMTPEEAKRFWAFQTPGKSAPPKVSRTDWPHGDIDRFVLAHQEAKGLQPSSDADRRVLIRRLSFDLIGLPPTPEEIDEFIKDTSENAIEKVVDRLLASPHFGERWGRHWLDLARFAESNGNADNTPFLHAWRYRNYVIDAFSQDKPYNRFITEQLAGDLLPSSSPAEKDEHLIATGFLALTSKPRAQNNPNFRMDLVADQIDVATRAVLGLTVMCARCHDHKFDAISTKEYYALAGIFESTQLLSGGVVRGAAGKRSGPIAGLHTLSAGEAMGVREGPAANSFIALRGESNQRGERVPRGFLAVATREKAPVIPTGQSGRLQLAEWLTDKDNPLTARVAVNRTWQALFGRGLVASPDNFGALGEKPTHPELLDWLAVRFVEDGWSMKKMIRLIVLSRTYQQSSNHSAINYKKDPDNLALWRMSPRRLEGEAIRDAILAASDKLDRRRPTGSLVRARLGKMAKKANFVVSESPCRSVYLGVPRGAPLPEILSLFDAANPNLVVARREVTTVPAQALFLMNSTWVREHARYLARRVLDTPSLDDAGRIDRAYLLALARPAATAERERVLAYLRGAIGSSRDPETTTKAWTQLCQVLFASAEFRYLD